MLSLFFLSCFLSANMSKDKNIASEVSGEVDPKLHIEAMVAEMTRMLS